MTERIQQNETLRKVIQAAQEATAAHAQANGITDPMDLLYLNLALEVVDLRIAFLRNQEAAAALAKAMAEAEAKIEAEAKKLDTEVDRLAAVKTGSQPIGDALAKLPEIQGKVQTEAATPRPAAPPAPAPVAPPAPAKIKPAKKSKG